MESVEPDLPSDTLPQSRAQPMPYANGPGPHPCPDTTRDTGDPLLPLKHRTDTAESSQQNGTKGALIAEKPVAIHVPESCCAEQSISINHVNISARAEAKDTNGCPDVTGAVPQLVKETLSLFDPSVLSDDDDAFNMEPGDGSEAVVDEPTSARTHDAEISSRYMHLKNTPPTADKCTSETSLEAGLPDVAMDTDGSQVDGTPPEYVSQPSEQDTVVTPDIDPKVTRSSSFTNGDRVLAEPGDKNSTTVPMSLDDIHVENTPPQSPRESPKNVQTVEDSSCRVTQSCTSDTQTLQIKDTSLCCESEEARAMDVENAHSDCASSSSPTRKKQNKAPIRAPSPVSDPATSAKVIDDQEGNNNVTAVGKATDNIAIDLTGVGVSCEDSNQGNASNLISSLPLQQPSDVASGTAEVEGHAPNGSSDFVVPASNLDGLFLDRTLDSEDNNLVIDEACDSDNLCPIDPQNKATVDVQINSNTTQNSTQSEECSSDIAPGTHNNCGSPDIVIVGDNRDSHGSSACDVPIQPIVIQPDSPVGPAPSPPPHTSPVLPLENRGFPAPERSYLKDLLKAGKQTSASRPDASIFAVGNTTPVPIGLFQNHNLVGASQAKPSHSQRRSSLESGKNGGCSQAKRPRSSSTDRQSEGGMPMIMEVFGGVSDKTLVHLHSKGSVEKSSVWKDVNGEAITCKSSTQSSKSLEGTFHGQTPAIITGDPKNPERPESAQPPMNLADFGRTAKSPILLDHYVERPSTCSDGPTIKTEKVDKCYDAASNSKRKSIPKKLAPPNVTSTSYNCIPQMSSPACQSNPQMPSFVTYTTSTLPSANTALNSARNLFSQSLSGLPGPQIIRPDHFSSVLRQVFQRGTTPFSGQNQLMSPVIVQSSVVPPACGGPVLGPLTVPSNPSNLNNSAQLLPSFRVININKPSSTNQGAPVVMAPTTPSYIASSETLVHSTSGMKYVTNSTADLRKSDNASHRSQNTVVSGARVLNTSVAGSNFIKSLPRGTKLVGINTPNPNISAASTHGSVVITVDTNPNLAVPRKSLVVTVNKNDSVPPSAEPADSGQTDVDKLSAVVKDHKDGFDLDSLVHKLEEPPTGLHLESLPNNFGYFCRGCHSRFVLKSTLSQHQLRRTMCIKYECNIEKGCRVLFYNPCQLNLHLRLHKPNPNWKSKIDIRGLPEELLEDQDKYAAVKEQTYSGYLPPKSTKNSLNKKTAKSQSKPGSSTPSPTTTKESNKVLQNTVKESSSAQKVPEEQVQSAKSEEQMSNSVLKCLMTSGEPPHADQPDPEKRPLVTIGLQVPEAVVDTTVYASRLICAECSTIFSNRSTLAAHMNNKSSNKNLFFCKTCPVVLRSKCAQKAHSRIHKNTEPYVCPECGQVIHGSHKVFWKHLHVKCAHHIRQATFTCLSCKTVRSTRKELAKHIVDIHITNFYKCLQCPMAFRSEDSLTSHVQSEHKGVKVFRKISKCVMCDAVYNYGPTLVEHLILAHIETNPKMASVVYRCNACDETFGPRVSCISHMEKAHKFYFNHNQMCHVCGSEFKTVATLFNHVRQKHPDLQELDAMVTQKLRKKGVIAGNTDVDTSTDTSAVTDIKGSQTHEEVSKNPNISSPSKPDADPKLETTSPNPCPKAASVDTDADDQKDVHPRADIRIGAIKKEPGLEEEKDAQANVKAFSCSRCQTDFTDAEAYQRHMAKHRYIEKKRIRSKSKDELVLKVKIPKIQDSGESSSSTVITEDKKLPTTPKVFVRQIPGAPEPEPHFHCSECLEGFHVEAALNKHLQDVHSTARQFPCHLCGMIYESSLAVKAHFSKEHEGISKDRPFVCWLCQEKDIRRAYVTRALLIKHLMSALHKVPRNMIDFSRFPDVDSTKQGSGKIQHTGPSNEAGSAGHEETPSVAGSTGDPAEMPPVKRLRLDGDSSYSCAKCSFSSESRDLFMEHIAKHQTSKMQEYNQCKECGLTFTVMPTLRKHLFIVHKVRNFTKYFENTGIDLVSQPKEEEILLPKSTANPADKLRRVNGIKQPKVSPVLSETPKPEAGVNECTVCYKMYDTDVELRTHMRTHGMAFIRSRRLDLP